MERRKQKPLDRWKRIILGKKKSGCQKALKIGLTDAGRKGDQDPRKERCEPDPAAKKKRGKKVGRMDGKTAASADHFDAVTSARRKSTIKERYRPDRNRGG